MGKKKKIIKTMRNFQAIYRIGRFSRSIGRQLRALRRPRRTITAGNTANIKLINFQLEHGTIFFFFFRSLLSQRLAKYELGAWFTLLTIIFNYISVRQNWTSGVSERVRILPTCVQSRHEDFQGHRSHEIRAFKFFLYFYTRYEYTNSAFFSDSRRAPLWYTIRYIISRTNHPPTSRKQYRK